MKYGAMPRLPVSWLTLFTILVLIPLSAAPETVFLGDYPKDREPGWSNECQGVTHDESFWYVTQRDRLWKFPVTFDLNRGVPSSIHRVGIPEPLKRQDYDHFGDLDHYRGHLFIPLEDKHYRQPKIVVFRAADLSFVAEGDLDVAQGGGHAMGCAVEPRTGLLYVSQFRHEDPASLRILVYRQELEGSRLRLRYQKKLALFEEDGRTPLHPGRMQGLAFSPTSGLLYVVSDTGSAGGIFVFDPDTGQRLQRIKVGYDPTFAGYTKEELEGITVWDLDGGPAPNIGGQVHLIMIDNVGRGADDLYFKHFRVPGEVHLSGREDCLPVQHESLEVRRLRDRWSLADATRTLGVFPNGAEAQRARTILASYRVTQICFVGRPSPRMTYYLVNGRSPAGPLAGEDCLGFDPSRLEVKWIGGQWKLTESGEHWMMDFGGEGLEARAALQTIRKHGFTQYCFVGRPDPSLVYFRR